MPFLALFAEVQRVKLPDISLTLLAGQSKKAGGRER